MKPLADKKSQQEGIYGYGLDDSTTVNVSGLALSSAKRLYKTIKENFGTIVFCRRYLDRLGQEKYLAGVSYHHTSLCLYLN